VPPSQQRTALVTGAARGIGAAIAAELSARGVNIVAPTRQELELGDPEAIEHFLNAQKASGVSIDILVNNAGINFIDPLEDIAQETWHKTFQVNVHAPFRLAQALAPAMKERRWGRIVNVSSMFSVVSRPHRTVYSATKSALNGLTRTLAIELGPANVLVNSVGPGYVETALTRQNNSAEELDRIACTIPLRRLAQPKEIATFVAFLCSEDNSYITGQLLLVDGGFTIL
jgi:NAD(P)-dependent dehydrogenase (short-subunit alcohol dehydrogenase family)